MRVVLARNLAMHASLWHNLHFPPPVIAQLTLWQIANIAWHPRNDKGEIKFPENELVGTQADMPLHRKLLAIQALVRGLGIPDAEFERVATELRAKDGGS